MLGGHNHTSDHDLLMQMHSNLEAFCKEHPDFIPSTAEGHALPAVALITPFLCGYWVLLSRYYKSVAKGSNYRFDGRFFNTCLPCCERVSIEDIVAKLVVPLVMFIAILYHIFILGKTILNAVLDVTGDVHGAILYAFLLYSVVCILKKNASLNIPENFPQVLMACCFATAAGLLYSHLVARCEYDKEMHKIFVVTPSILATVCFLAQVWNPNSFLLAAAGVFWAFMVGSGFMVIGFIGFIFKNVSQSWKEMPTAHKRQMMAPYFCMEFIFVVSGFTLCFILFGKLRGNRLGKLNSDYVCRANGHGKSPSVVYSPLKTADVEHGNALLP